MRTTRLLAALASLALLLPAMPAGALGKDKKTLRWGDDHPSVFFVGEDRLLVSLPTGGSRIVSYPEMAVVAELESPIDSAVDVLKVSKNRRWLAAHYKKDRLRVWDLSSLEPVLTIADRLSQTFRLNPKEDRLVLYQPKIGITQWDLGTGQRVEPTIDAVRTVRPGWMVIAPNGRYLWVLGRCRADERWYDKCLFDLRDGSTVAWANDPASATFFSTDKEWALIDEFAELVDASGIPTMDELPPPNCQRRPDGLLFCCSLASAALTDESQEPERPAEAAGGLKGFFKQTMEQSRPPEFPGRYQWKIAATNERKRFHIGSCDLSEDGEWVVLGVNSAEVLLYSTQRLERAGLKLMGKWQQPALVNSFELP